MLYERRNKRVVLVILIILMIALAITQIWYVLIADNIKPDPNDPSKQRLDELISQSIKI